jgi:hypothetical protein
MLAPAATINVKSSRVKPRSLHRRRVSLYSAATNDIEYVAETFWPSLPFRAAGMKWVFRCFGRTCPERHHAVTEMLRGGFGLSGQRVV